MPRLPRILYAVPRLPHAHLEIAKAIQTLEQDSALEKYELPSQINTPSNTLLLAEQLPSVHPGLSRCA